MARLLLIASLVGARGASGLASAGDLERMQMSRAALTLSTDAVGREFTYAGVRIYPHTPFRFGDDGNQHRTANVSKAWLFKLKATATRLQLQEFVQKLHPTAMMTNPDIGELPFADGQLTDEELLNLLDEYQKEFPGFVVGVEEDMYENWIPDVVEETGVTTTGTYPWGIEDIDAHVIRGRGVGVNVFVHDTGIRISHSQFGGRAFAGVDMSSGSLVVCSPSDTACAADAHWHGTHCAGTVGSQTYGVADAATLWAVKVLADNGYGSYSWILGAEQWVLSSGARPAVVSMSLGSAGSGASFAFHQDSIDALVNDGVTVVVAAGNDNDDACNYNPAWIPSAITVGSYAAGGARSVFSNYGTCIDVWAPGSGILSLDRASDSATRYASGTSMACPHVSGLAAIVYEYYPTAASMTPSQRWDLLTASNRTGYITGLPATPASVNLIALAPTTSPTSSPTSSPTPSPTPSPTLSPTPSPTLSPTPSPTPSPTAAFTASGWVIMACSGGVEDILMVVKDALKDIMGITPIVTIDIITTGSRRSGLQTVNASYTVPTGSSAEATAVASVLEPTTVSNALQTRAAGSGLTLDSRSISVGPVTVGTATIPTPAPTPLTGGVGATGDPHLQNIHGERFDLMQPGKHVLINIPRKERAENALLHVQADAQRLGGQCTDMYFQEVNITGVWAAANSGQKGGLRYHALDVGSKRARWVRFGPVQLKIAHGHTLQGAKYLNLYVKGLGRAGFAVGGLLGEDDHSEQMLPQEACAHRMAL